MPFEAPLSTWMPGEEAIRHIQNAERRTEADAIEQLKKAIAHCAVGARVPGGTIPLGLTTHTGPGATPMVSPGRGRVPPPQAWTKADIGADGTVTFGPDTLRYQFEVLREQVLSIWPAQPLRVVDVIPFAN